MRVKLNFRIPFVFSRAIRYTSMSKLMSCSFLSIDGSPLPPVENPVYMSDTGLTSLTIMWGVAPVPLDAPLLGYNITYESVNGTGDQNYVETSNNSTAITLTSLKLATTYSIRVQGINKIGAGNLSAPLLASTMVGVPPLPPTSVTVTDISLVTASNYRVKLQWAVSTYVPLFNIQ